jgi:hypothetical protein
MRKAPAEVQMTKICDTEPKQDNCLVRLKAPDSLDLENRWVLSDKFGREPISTERTVDVSRQHATELLAAGWHEIGPTPELYVQPYMIEPMTRPGGAGYVHLSSALLWIMTKGAPEPKSLTNSETWQAAVDLLLPLIRTGEVEIVGRPEGIRPQMFAGAAVSGPLNNCARPGCERWIWSMPYVDPQTWDERGFNDQLYLRVTEPAAFTHLEVRKSDILREFAFPNLGCPSSGAGPVVDLPDPTPTVLNDGHWYKLIEPRSAATKSNVAYKAISIVFPKGRVPVGLTYREIADKIKPQLVKMGEAGGAADSTLRRILKRP